MQTKGCAANLWPKIRTQTRDDGAICKIAVALCKRSSAADSLSVALIIPRLRLLRRSLYLFYATGEEEGRGTRPESTVLRV